LCTQFVFLLRRMRRSLCRHRHLSRDSRPCDRCVYIRLSCWRRRPNYGCRKGHAGRGRRSHCIPASHECKPQYRGPHSKPPASHHLSILAVYSTKSARRLRPSPSAIFPCNLIFNSV
jgi:hypothetical protein